MKTPSLYALAIDAAHKRLREAIGTEREAAMYAELERVVARVKERRA